MKTFFLFFNPWSPSPVRVDALVTFCPCSLNCKEWVKIQLAGKVSSTRKWGGGGDIFLQRNSDKNVESVLLG